ncbi:amino acid ABC transporter substrate-binding protein [Agrobacterium tumefaciens]|uniref:amino acid ABC transporter substrate-binding protein n=1 Tax=Agrobacterium tumefaciens TaxID=358 RepID=UPI001F3C5644|nr:amino acid ABC transporter substrate-binding protein [Agrobacterium tumefaciens]
MQLKSLGMKIAPALVLSLLASGAIAATLDTVKQRGSVICGVHGARAGFSLLDAQGKWSGIDVDTCRAIAAATLGDESKVQFVKTTSQTRFPLLQSGEVDVLTNNVTHTLLRDTSLGFDFAATTFYDAQAFMVNSSLGSTSVRDLDGATVCVGPGTNSEKVVADVFRQNSISYTPVAIENAQERAQAFFSGRCDVNVESATSLLSQRATLASNPDDFVLLPEMFGKDPMAAVVRQDDAAWKDIVNWTVNAMIQAEEFEITSQNVDEKKSSEDPQVQRFLGVTPGNGKALGLDEDWAYRIVKQVGNYGEVYDRSFGDNTVFKLPRGKNAIWTEGGLLYSAPFN